MAGIFAIYSYKQIITKEVRRLADLNRTVSDNGYGLVVASNYHHRFYSHIAEPDWTHYINPKTRLVLGHCVHANDARTISLEHLYAASLGDIKSTTGHYINIGDLTADILNYWNLSERTLSIPECIAKVMEIMTCHASFWLYDRREKRAYMWRQGSSLYYGLVDGHMMYSYAPVVESMLPFPENVVYEITTLSPVPVALF